MDSVSQHLRAAVNARCVCAYSPLVSSQLDSQNSLRTRSEEIKQRVSSSTLVSGFIHKHNIPKSNIDPGT